MFDTISLKIRVQIIRVILLINLVLISYLCFGQYPYDFKFGSSGSGNGQFSSPSGIAFDAEGNIYVTDRSNDRVQIFDSNGNYLDQFGTSGSGNGQLDNPYDIVISSEQKIYVSEATNRRVQIFDLDGNYLDQFGESGTGDGQLIFPMGLGIDASNNIYVVDRGNDRIQKFDKDGNFLFKLGTQGFGDNEFYNPNDIAVDSEGNFYVSDDVNDKIRKFDSSGTFVTSWGSLGSGNSQFSNPRGITVDGADLVYIADYNNDRVSVFDADGVYQNQIGTFGSSDGSFDSPFFLAVNTSGQLIVSDGGNNRVQGFTGATPVENIFLPVNLIFFNAKASNQEISLSWSTAQEVNNKGFEVQRSDDSNSWETVSFINGHGTTNIIQSYSFEDNNPYNGVNYYRLKQVDYDGAFEYSKIVEVSSFQKESSVSIQVYPNPSSDYIKVTGFGNAAKIDISIYNQLGKLVYSSSTTSHDEIDIISLKAGTYIVIAKSASFNSKKMIRKV